jgi:hypothetical protein
MATSDTVFELMIDEEKMRKTAEENPDVSFDFIKIF